MCQLCKLVFIMFQKLFLELLFSRGHFALGGGEWPECLEVPRCVGAGHHPGFLTRRAAFKV